MTLGPATYAGPSAGLAFTHAQLPGTTCIGGGDRGFTQFSLTGIQTPSDAAWSLSGGAVILSYYDLLIRDAFPLSPTPSGSALLFFTGPFGLGLGWWNASVDFQSVDQPSPVPEPATMTLFGVGLAAAAWRRRKQ